MVVAALGGAEAPRAAGFAACGGALAATAAIRENSGLGLERLCGCWAGAGWSAFGRTGRAQPRSGSADRPTGQAQPDTDRQPQLLRRSTPDRCGSGLRDCLASSLDG